MVRAAAIAVLVVLAVPGIAQPAVFPFPSENSTYVSDEIDLMPDEVGYFWSTERGDRVTETFSATKNVDRAVLRVQTPYNSLNAPVTWGWEIGGVPVRTFEVPAANGTSLVLEASFAPITGPTYAVTLRLLSGASDGGRHSFASGGPLAHSLELLDTLAPNTRIDGSSQVVGGPTEMRFSSPATDVARFECSLDGASFAACVSPVSYPLLPLGEHTFRVRAVDDVGNIDPTPARWTWPVTPPASCPNDAATVQAGTVAILKLACVTYDRRGLSTSVVKRPGIGTLGPIDQVLQTVAYTAPTVAGLTSFSYRSRASNVATFALTIRGPIGSGVSAGWRVARDHTKARRLSATDVPAWSTVSVRCMHKGCSYHRSWAASAATHKALNLLGDLAHSKLRPGTVVEVRIAAPYATAKVVRYTIRAHRAPRRTVLQTA